MSDSTVRHAWLQLTGFGDSALLLPCALLLSAWLALDGGAGHSALRWTLTWLACGLLVAITKVLFMGWGIGLPRLDFTGLSGHSALACLIWPVLWALLLGQHSSALRWAGLSIGVLLAAAVVISRVRLGAHSPSEAVLGALLGLSLAALFLWSVRAGGQLAWPSHRGAAGVLLVVVVTLALGHRFPSQALLEGVARGLSGRAHVYTRHDLRVAAAVAAGPRVARPQEAGAPLAPSQVDALPPGG